MIDIKDVKKENIINTKENKNELLEYLKANFPQTISDNVPNLNAIMQLLGLNTKAQGYELTFTGKALANALYSTPNTKELKFHKGLSKNFETTKNAIIKGDNLDALKLLKSAYYEKIKMIYIDPPYNTKNDNFIYKDDFVKEHKKLLMEVGLLEITEEGEEIRSEILNFFINAKGDRSHSAWLGFMLPRLKLARDLLKEDGVIFISIDDNEQANLKILCDEIFGEENFVACMPIVTNPGGRDYGEIAITHEYLLVYQKNIEFEALYMIEDKEKKFQYIDKQGKFDIMELRNRNIIFNSHNRPNLYYPFYVNENNIDDNGFYEISLKKQNNWIEVFPLESQGIHTVWRWGKDKVVKFLNTELKAKKKNDGNFMIIQKYRKNTKRQKSVWDSTEFITEKGSSSIKELFNGKKIFDYPKSIKTIMHLLKLSTNTNKNDIILDFFAGSGTTAQAVMELNAEDNGNRKFILVQLDEKIDEKKSKVAYDFCKNELSSKNPVISDITIERVKRAGEKILKENVDKNLDLGFKVFSMVEKPELIKDELNTLNLKYHEHLTPYEKALNLALLDGKTLDKDLKMILKDKLYSCQDCFYIVNCDDEVLEFLRKTQNENVYINGYDDMNLEDYLNLESFLKERLKVVY